MSRFRTFDCKLFIGFFSALLAVELFARSDQLATAPLERPDTFLFRKRGWLQRQPPQDVLIAGDSSGHRGIDATAFMEGARASALNASYTTGTAPVMRFMLNGLSWRPKRIVYAMTPVLFVDNYAAEPHEIEAMDLIERMQLQGWGPGLLGSVWATYRRRNLVLQGAKFFVKTRFLGGPRPASDTLAFSEGGDAEDEHGSLAVHREPPENMHPVARSLWSRWHNGRSPERGARAAAFEALARSWHERGIPITYVLMPLHSALRELLAESKAFDEFHSNALRSIIVQYGGRVLDCRSVLPDQAFYDADHLRESPWRKRFSRQLGIAVVEEWTTCGPVSD